MVKFKDLKIGDKFEVWGDQHLNYNYPVLCVCIKVDETTGQELDGIKFGIHENSNVMEHE